ncbi:type VI secretion system baseplate subunit TssE [Escherichia coli]|nr:type VI secretion IcmF C-terminal domain-containing protein [Escherichia coli]EHV4497948.1 type VI secretion system baseplate subunit TssE [Escherichia coli]EHZ8243836.1 type VI secretion system baseplate subunit TssE [Escherichia coli]
MLILAWIFLLVWIWWKGPTWTLYEEQWLKPLANRWLATAAWGIIALMWLTVRVMKRLQQLEKMQKQQREEAVDPLSVELNAQQRYLDRWLLRLQRHLDNRRFLWQLPWYMVIGPAGSGKTTLLREGFPSDIIYAPEGARGAEQRLYLTPHVGKQAVIFDIDGTLCAPADADILHRRLTEQYISDYTATWRAGMDNLNIRNFESIGQLTGALEQVISGDQPLQRALTVLRDNTQPGVFSEKLSAKEREEALAEPDYQLLTRLGHEFAPENSTLAVQKDKESTMQAVYQQLTELHRYLLAIQNAPVPGKSALKAVQLRLDQNSSDPIFATRQMAKTLPAPLNRWVGRLTDQAWHVVMVEAVHYMEVDWRDSVVKPFNEQLANNYPFNPRSAQDASLDAFERFFKPDGILDTFYQQNLKLFIDNDLSLEDGDNSVIIREDIIAQLKTAQKIRDIFFSKQNGLGTSFAVETVSLSGNKRRSVLNLDGQLVDYSQGRNYTAHLVWPNNMREGNESKLTLVGANGGAPRSISFSGPWAQFRLFGAGQLTGVQDGNFTVRFSVDGGAMTYRVHTDTEDNPFSGGLFSQFGLSDTLY